MIPKKRLDQRFMVCPITMEITPTTVSISAAVSKEKFVMSIQLFTVTYTPQDILVLNRGSILLTASAVSGFMRKPQAPVSHALKA